MRPTLTPALIADACGSFQTEGTFLQALAYGNGHINDTFLAEFRLPNGRIRRSIVQRINTDVFPHPQELMENIQHVTCFLSQIIAQEGGDVQRENLHVVPAKNHTSLYTDPSGGVWRCFDFIQRTTALQAATEVSMYESACAFGRFQRRLLDFPAHTLHETIPDFHNTPFRFAQLMQSVRQDRAGRVKDVQREIEFVLEREQDAKALVHLLASGALPLRVTHNDTKLSNVLLDATTGKGLCVIDLDTVMPGLVAYDFGDSIRFGASTAAEDEPDLSRVGLSMPLFEAYAKGFLNAVNHSLTRNEIESLPIGAKLMTLECGMRFLADYLDGDLYFKTSRPGQNLDRCRTQWKLVREMEHKMDQMQQVIKSL